MKTTRRPLRIALTALVSLTVLAALMVAGVAHVHYCEDYLIGSVRGAEIPAICQINNPDHPLISFFSAIFFFALPFLVTLWTWLLLGKLLGTKPSANKSQTD